MTKQGLFQTFWSSHDSSANTLGLAAQWHPLHNGQESQAYRDSRLDASLVPAPGCYWDIDFERMAAYNMGSELTPGGLTEAQLQYMETAEFFGRQ